MELAIPAEMLPYLAVTNRHDGGGAGTQALPQSVDPAWPAALLAVTPGLLALLADEDPQVRRAATFPGRDRRPDSDQAVAGLRARLEAEPDPAIRYDVTVALATAAAGTALQGAELADAAMLARDEPDPQARLAAVHALARLGQPGNGQASLMVEATTHPSVAWLCSPVPTAFVRVVRSQYFLPGATR